MSAPTDRGIERAPFFAILPCAAVLAWAFFLTDLPGPLAAIALILLGGAAVVALAASRREVRADGAVALVFACLAVAGQVRERVGFGVGALVTVAACVYVMRRARAPVARRGVRASPIVLVVAAGAPVAAAIALGLPPLSRIAEGRIAAYLASAPIGNQTGFAAERMPIGSTVGLLIDDEIVLRVRGETSPLLRGEVYDNYMERAGWTSSLGDTLDVAAAETRDHATTIIGPETDRFFVPHTHACVGTKSGRARATRGGVFRPSLTESGRRVTSSASCPPGAIASAVPPGPADLDVPEGLAALLDETLDRWKVRANFGASAQLSRIQKGLGLEHGYALDVARDDRLDPLIDFLTKHPDGHCELFASAAALLARRAGIPARVVAGYRVVEKSRFGDWHVVRNSHAHAWIEAWEGDRWVTLDPTPAREGAGRPAPSLLSSLSDLGAAVWYEARARVTGTTLFLIGSAIAFAVIFGRELRTRLRARRSRRRRGATDALPAFRELSHALAQRGLERAPGEPLERFARRIREVDEAWGRACASALLAYAALRYGGEGAEADVSAQMRDSLTLL